MLGGGGIRVLWGYTHQSLVFIKVTGCHFLALMLTWMYLQKYPCSILLTTIHIYLVFYSWDLVNPNPITLFSQQQLQASTNNMDADNDAFMLVRVYFFRITFFQCVNAKK